MDEAKALISKGKYAEAIPVLEIIASSDKTSAPQALQMLGDCYNITQRASKALECFEKLLADHPNSVAPDKVVRGWIMDSYLANSQPEKALALRKELLSQYQSDAWRLYYIIGRRYVWRHEYGTAIPELAKAVELGAAAKNDPEMIDADWLLIHCYVMEKQWAKAEAVALQLIAGQPDVAYRFYGELGRCYQGREEYGKAVECLEAAVKLSPKDAENLKDDYKSLLRCYEVAGGPDEVMPLARRLVADYPEQPAWRWELGRQHLDRGEYAKAAPLFKEVIESSKERWEIRSSRIYLGQCMYRCGKGAGALADIERYYRDKPDLWDDHLLVRSAVLYYGPKDYEGCVAGLRELIAGTESGKASALVETAKELMSRARAAMGDQAQSAALLEQMANESKDPALLCQAARAYCKSGKHTQARHIFRTVSESTNTSDEIKATCKYGLAICYWHSGLKNSAQRLARRTAELYPGTDAARQARGALCVWSGTVDGRLASGE